MKEYEFTAKAVAFFDDGQTQKLIVYCPERDDCKLVITMGRAQIRISADAAEATNTEVIA